MSIPLLPSLHTPVVQHILFPPLPSSSAGPANTKALRASGDNLPLLTHSQGSQVQEQERVGVCWTMVQCQSLVTERQRCRLSRNPGTLFRVLAHEVSCSRAVSQAPRGWLRVALALEPRRGEGNCQDASPGVGDAGVEAGQPCLLLCPTMPLALVPCITPSSRPWLYLVQGGRHPASYFRTVWCFYEQGCPTLSFIPIPSCHPPLCTSP